MITVAELFSTDQLAEYQLLWQAFHSQTPGASIFLDRDYLTQSLKQNEGQSQLRALIVTLAHRPIGIVPLVVRPVSTIVGTLRALTFPRLQGPIFLSALGPNPTATLTAAFQHLASSSRGWDLIDLENLDTRRDNGRTANAFRLAGLSAVERKGAELARIDLSTLDAGQRFLYRRQLKSLERSYWQSGKWEHVQLCPRHSQSLPSLWTQVEQVYTNLKVAEPSWLKDAMTHAARQNALCVQMIRSAGRPVACLISAAGQQRVEILASVTRCRLAEEILVGRLLFDEVVGGSPEVVFSAQTRTLADPWGGKPCHSSRMTHYSVLSPRAQLLRMASWWHRTSSPGNSVKPIVIGRVGAAVEPADVDFPKPPERRRALTR